MLPAPTRTELERVQAAAVDWREAATPPAKWMVPVPATTVPKVDIATGINMLAPTPATNTPPLSIAAFLITSILHKIILKNTLYVHWKAKSLI